MNPCLSPSSSRTKKVISDLLFWVIITNRKSLNIPIMLCPEHPLDESKIGNARQGEGGQCNLESPPLKPTHTHTHIHRQLTHAYAHKPNTHAQVEMTEIAITKGKGYKRGCNTNKGMVCVAVSESVCVCMTFASLALKQLWSWMVLICMCILSEPRCCVWRRGHTRKGKC